jgi:hypothetical protein
VANPCSGHQTTTDQLRTDTASQREVANSPRSVVTGGEFSPYVARMHRVPAGYIRAATVCLPNGEQRRSTSVFVTAAGEERGPGGSAIESSMCSSARDGCRPRPPTPTPEFAT